MKADKGKLSRLLAEPDPAVRFYLFYGPDEESSAALAKRLLQGLGVEKAPLDAATLKSDPARLADEASAISMFGGRQLIWIEPAGDEIAGAVEGLLDAPAVEHVVVAVGGSLRKNGALLKVAEDHPATLTHISYAPEGRDLDRLIEAIAHAEGLRPEPGVIKRLSDSVGGHRTLTEQEIVKFALFLEASPERPQPLTHETLDQLGADFSEEALFAVGDSAMAGDIHGLRMALRTLSGSGTEAIPIIRAMQRRILQLAPMQARVSKGEAVAAVMASQGKSLFWKDKPAVQRMLQIWNAERLERLSERVAMLERELMFTKAPTRPALGEELLAIARVGARQR